MRGATRRVALPNLPEAYWELPERHYVYWRGTVTSADLLEEPFRQAS